ncbi:RecA-like protein [Xanthomonas phage XacN1]|nr:RecA-like protein [Xanthomonas phage XacN1]
MSSFFKDLRKSEAKLEESGIAVKSERPKYWISLGNFTLNKIISGMFRGGIGQGRLAAITGPSSAGKSFIAGNVAREAQKQGLGLLVLDSENALDDGFMQGLGVDTEREDYFYRGISSIPEATKMVSGFIKSYREHKETQPFLIILDSIDMLRTASQEANYESGETKGDQGQHAKQVKDMLAPWVHDIKNLNISIVCTKQVFQEQDPMLQKNPQTAWKFTESAKYAFSQILLVTRFMLKDESGAKIPGKKDTNYSGIRLKAYGMKTRFTKPFQSATVEVPYETGMDPYDGLLDAAKMLGVVTGSGAWNYLEGTDVKWSGDKGWQEVKEQVLEACIAKESEFLDVQLEGEIVEATDGNGSKSDQRKKKLMDAAATDDAA